MNNFIFTLIVMILSSLVIHAQDGNDTHLYEFIDTIHYSYPSTLAEYRIAKEKYRTSRFDNFIKLIEADTMNIVHVGITGIGDSITVMISGSVIFTGRPNPRQIYLECLGIKIAEIIKDDCNRIMKIYFPDYRKISAFMLDTNYSTILISPQINMLVEKFQNGYHVDSLSSPPMPIPVESVFLNDAIGIYYYNFVNPMCSEINE